MKKFRLILSEDTFLWVKNNEGLAYQSKNYRSFVFSMTDKLHGICSHLLVLEHLYTVELTCEDLNNRDVRFFVDKMIEIDAGRLITETKKEDVSLMPVLKIHEQVDYFKEKHERGIGGRIIKHIHELTFYLTGSKYGNDLYYQQTIFPTKDKLMQKKDRVLRFIRNSKNLFLANINLVGDIFSYPDFEELLNHIETFEIKVTLCITASDVLANKDKLSRYERQDQFCLRIMMDKKENIEQVAAYLEDKKILLR